LSRVRGGVWVRVRVEARVRVRVRVRVRFSLHFEFPSFHLCQPISVNQRRGKVTDNLFVSCEVRGHGLTTVVMEMVALLRVWPSVHTVTCERVHGQWHNCLEMVALLRVRPSVHSATCGRVYGQWCNCRNGIMVALFAGLAFSSFSDAWKSLSSGVMG
jgi:hypothetical protein